MVEERGRETKVKREVWKREEEKEGKKVGETGGREKGSDMNEGDKHFIFQGQDVLYLFVFHLLQHLVDSLASLLQLLLGHQKGLHLSLTERRSRGREGEEREGGRGRREGRTGRKNKRNR